MIYILEGPEAAGKSTLARRLHELTGFPVVHRSKPENEEERLKMLDMYTQAIIEKKDMIWDRSWYSEIVYGRIMRDKSYISLGAMYDLERLLKNNGGGIIFHCTDPVTKLWTRCKIRGEEYITEYEALYKIKEGFEELFNTGDHYLPIVRYELSKNLPGM